ncbi:MAG: radical SAM protein, partial [Candidatus Aenigmatarchaeota archaeon]
MARKRGRRPDYSGIDLTKGHGHAHLVRKTSSLCPKCLKIIEADIFKRNGMIWIAKKCPKHGEIEDLYFGDAEMYEKFERWAHIGKGIQNPTVNKDDPVCPKDCGLCKIHDSHTALANVVVTNRCDLTCWYCFFYAKAMGYVYEPTLMQLRQMFKNLRAEK